MLFSVQPPNVQKRKLNQENAVFSRFSMAGEFITVV
jgi:hypothetical protein